MQNPTHHKKFCFSHLECRLYAWRPGIAQTMPQNIHVVELIFISRNFSVMRTQKTIDSEVVFFFVHICYGENKKIFIIGKFMTMPSVNVIALLHS